ncbi:HlyD family type I secretion periplasmic adaptor subunit [Rickettsia endosymbiont of Cardiosporidium cionae]|uniref:HlyD family type I secretion periplasmic adaptor subunit n=1 Tax=Rickettsia endosymbiont of Cardiosporidium cionae TaxID=2777155 RepID=UPI0018933085|nr:HlyD family type I secretion periplasmic adaptor subunit [Rickettsia endosymbiont of Cardiosporidium cionae]KAF8818237.1 HlyD family type I secretion periplasmic adaptor subunit [Rickettsia endosymbiont of Cardiosporidium cionae]
MSNDQSKKHSDNLIKLQQLLELQNKAKTNSSNKTFRDKFKIQSILQFIIKKMQKWVGYIDLAINFIINKKLHPEHDVVNHARAPILFGAYIIVFFVIFGLIWSVVAPLDSSSTAIGRVINTSKTKVLNHPNGGIIKEIHVKLGDRVKKGDTLITLDDIKERVKYEDVLNQYRELVASETRLIAEISNSDHVEYNDPLLEDLQLDPIKKIIKIQNSIFESRKQSHQASINAFLEKIKQTKQPIEGLNARNHWLKNKLELAQQRATNAKTLAKKGFIKQDDLMEAQNKVIEIQSAIDTNLFEKSKIENEISEIQLRLIQHKSEINVKTFEELKETRTRARSAKESLTEISYYLSKSIIRATEDGIINRINFHSVGQNIPPSYTILEISPLNDNLIIEAQIEPSNIDSVSVGLKTKIRFSAFKSRTSPVFKGELVSLSPDVILERSEDTGSRAYYLAEIKIDIEHFNQLAKLRNLEISPGMQAEIQIVTGTRTLFRYLIDPIIDAMFKGLNER